MDFQKILDFWFKENKDNWFKKSPAFDEQIKKEFSSIHEKIAQGNMKEWENSPKSLLAMVIVLDQFSRNMFRGTKKSFDYDIQALELSKKAIANKFDEVLSPIERSFLYLPFEHSEKISDQEQCLKLFGRLKDADPKFGYYYDFADRHYQIIKRFNRFPHRNEILQRNSTPEEIEFLKTAGSSF